MMTQTDDAAFFVPEDYISQKLQPYREEVNKALEGIKIVLVLPFGILMFTVMFLTHSNIHVTTRVNVRVQLLLTTTYPVVLCVTT